MLMRRIKPFSRPLIQGTKSAQSLTRMNSSSAGTSLANTQVIPRAAVSVVVRYSQEAENRYVLVQRGKEPNKVSLLT